MEKLPQYKIIDEELIRFQKRLFLEEETPPAEVRRVLRCILDNLFDPELNVTLVRERCSIRNHNISMRFRFAMGIGLREYIEEKRLQAATLLLEYPQIEVYMVAMSVGFTHAESFNRSFKRRMGCSPSEHRQRTEATRRQSVPAGLASPAAASPIFDPVPRPVEDTHRAGQTACV